MGHHLSTSIVDNVVYPTIYGKRNLNSPETLNVVTNVYRFWHVIRMQGGWAHQECMRVLH